ncbi:hypothetical protein B0A48_11137 [Cryoendolithus antarcticus]|uniref:F-box domain-containing protein n=1 Tax=Cryoendolithus antarcticus TaxID=1507870 RepID=A0A1V8SUX9_9PEZI|nr:hypothetical protein B0A48_11137 [Cryoendolithus antarcticus]
MSTMAAESVEDATPGSTATDPSSAVEQPASFRLLELPKELRLAILEITIISCRPSVTLNIHSDELISKRDFERRCARFVELPILHTCKLLREEATPIVDNTIEDLNSDLRAEITEWRDIDENVYPKEGPQTLDEVESKIRIQRELEQLYEYIKVALETHMAWHDVYEGQELSAAAAAFCGFNGRVGRKYRKDGECEEGGMYEVLPNEDLSPEMAELMQRYCIGSEAHSPSIGVS